MIILDEKNKIIDHNLVESLEWKLCEKFITPNDVVLELGARYGTSSIIIDRILANKKNQVCVEPDSAVWDVLESNKFRNNAEFEILKGAISKKKLKLEPNGYSSICFTDGNGSVPIFDLWEIEEKFNLKFNVLVADCEGCLSTFINEYPTFFQQLNLFIYEEDEEEKCDYDKLKILLNDFGFYPVIVGYHNVYKK
jgi:FkbM family methyltransferase